MAAITEDYVSFETAKLLNDKGFDEPCIAYWFHMINAEPIFNDNMPRQVYNNKSDTIEIIGCPTLQIAMKWLRRVYNLHCVVDYDFVLGWYCQITSLKETVEYNYKEMKHYHPEKDNGFSSSEEACEAAIKYCLENLI